MKTITFECEVITPMFLAGADGKTPELRPPSIKGAMRFWWRAMNGNLSLTELKKKETEIFGGGGEDAGRSSFSIGILKKLNKEDISDKVYEDIGAQIKTARSGKNYIDSRNAKYKGIAYLFYSTWLDTDNIRKSFKPGSTFSFSISFTKYEYISEILKTLKVLEMFGALGTRSRRGAGAFKINEYKLNEELNKLNIDFKELINPNMSVSDLVQMLDKSTENKQYSTLKGAQIYFGKKEDNWKLALENIGRPFTDYRSKNKDKITETPNFGFPILHRNKKTTMIAGKKALKNGKEKIVEKLERRASPLIFKIIKENNKYIPLIIWLNGNLIPNGYNIMDTYGNNQGKSENTIINNFFLTEFNKQNADIVI